MRTPRLGIPTRIFSGFSLVVLAFAALAFGSIRQHQQSAETLRLLGEGYLPLAFDVSSARSAQGVVSTLVDRILDEADANATRRWLEVSRRTRPSELRRLLDDVARVDALLGPGADRASLDAIRVELDRVSVAYRTNEQSFEELTRALAAHDAPSAERIVSRLRTSEHRIDASLRNVARRVQGEITDMGAAAKDSEERSLKLLAFLALLALATGVLVSLWARRVLVPLTKLEERVVAIAQGAKSEKLVPARNDEIGQLTAEFERMVDAELRTTEKLVQSERLAAIGRMAAHVTHEVRNPLSSIGLNVEMLEEETQDAGPETRTLLRAIHREIDRLTEVTEEYLRLARLPTPKLVRQDLVELASDTVSFLKAESTSAGVALELRTDVAEAFASIDESQIRQALLNLIRNAREAVGQGGHVEVCVAIDGANVIVDVADDGPGIPSELLDRIFEPFFTTKDRGTGLGLSLTQQIAAAHGARLECLPNAPKGTRFRFTFARI